MDVLACTPVDAPTPVVDVAETATINVAVFLVDGADEDVTLLMRADELAVGGPAVVLALESE
jgi:hypothetical protein